MFCTGIRCEKSTAYLKEQGFEEVYHLQGGILKYLEEVPKDETMWEGECFVFDDRVAVNHDLKKVSMISVLLVVIRLLRKIKSTHIMSVERAVLVATINFLPIARRVLQKESARFA